MEKEEIKNNVENSRESESSSVSDKAREGLFAEAMKEMGMPDGKAKPTDDQQGSASESSSKKNQQAPATERESNPSAQNENTSRKAAEQYDPSTTKNVLDVAKANQVDHLKNPAMDKHISDAIKQVNPAEQLKNPAMDKNISDAIKQVNPAEQLKNPAMDKNISDAIKQVNPADQLKNPIDQLKNPVGDSIKPQINPDDLKNPIGDLNKPQINPDDLKNPIGDLNKPQINPDDLKNPIDKIKVDDLKGLDKNENIGEILKELSMRNHDYTKPFGKGADGDHILPTGDRMQRKNGQETLTTPNGDTVTVNSDGTFKTTGDVRKINENKDGTHTITYGDGSRVTIGKDGVQRVERGNDRVRFRQLELNTIKPSILKELNPALKAR